MRYSLIAAACVAFCLAAQAQDINPCPEGAVPKATLVQWTFDKGVEGWQGANDCTLAAAGGVLKITMTGNDPYLRTPLAAPLPGPVGVKLRMRMAGGGAGQIFWSTTRRGEGPDACETFPLADDNQWHDYLVPLSTDQPLTGLRIDPGMAPGQAEIDSVEIVSMVSFPLVIEKFRTGPAGVEAVIRNRSDKPVDVTACGQAMTVPPGQTATAAAKFPGRAAFESADITLDVKGVGQRKRTAVAYNPAGPAEWITLKNDQLTLKVAKDASGLLVERDGKLAAVVTPLVAQDGEICRLSLANQTANSLDFAQGELKASLALTGDEIAFTIKSPVPVEGPVVRPAGGLEQGLLAGLEYLGKGETSSSTLDVETADHLRFAPNRLYVTMPLMVCVTDRSAVAMRWSDMTLQPTYACPNFYDGVYGEQRMSLRGREMSAVVRVYAGSVEDAVAWFLAKVPLPELPKAPRDAQAQLDLAMKALNGPIKGEGGWGHCAQPSWARHPFADIASTIWRITGQIPDLPRLVPGGAHVPNESLYFVTGRGQEWLDRHRRETGGIIHSQKSDGSFRYDGPFRKGHYEDTASGWCALMAARLLEFAWQSGDGPARDAGLKALDYMKRFRVPRGAQTWELSLHTPDILASAYLVRAYVRGYELTGRAEYLDQARRWALSGVPFVYLWGRYPIMTYATIPVYGATHFRAPLWIGLPVQWCGGVYAYDLLRLARYDHTANWRQIAEGIYRSATQQIYPDGPSVGCLPDSFNLAAQRRQPADINPCAIVCLQFELEGKPAGLDTAANATHRVTAPFPVTIRDNQACIQAKAGLKYQALINGKIVEVTSKGQDVLKLE